MSDDVDVLLAALERSHGRLVEALEAVGDDVEGPSYDDGWTIAQVASHLGSGADIFGLILGAGQRGDASPGPDDMKPVWERWNAKTAVEQSRDVVAADAGFIQQATAIEPAARERWVAEVFGGPRTLADLLRMRLGEHLMHTWDIAVMLEPSTTIEADGTALFLSNLALLAGLTGKGVEAPVTVRVETTDPAHAFLLELGSDAVKLSESEGAAAATLRLPAEAFARLVYGRLDPQHTPTAVETDGVDLDTLRAAFPGF